MKTLKIIADFITTVEINNISVLVVFNVLRHNANEFKEGDKIGTVELSDESGDWVCNKTYTFMEWEASTSLSKHIKIKLVG